MVFSKTQILSFSFWGSGYIAAVLIALVLLSMLAAYMCLLREEMRSDFEESSTFLVMVARQVFFFFFFWGGYCLNNVLIKGTRGMYIYIYMCDIYCLYLYFRLAFVLVFQECHGFFTVAATLEKRSQLHQLYFVQPLRSLAPTMAGGNQHQPWEKSWHFGRL